MTEATSTIGTPVGETFTLSAWVTGTTHGVYDVEVGPRTTYRRTPVVDLTPEDVLMDVFGSPTNLVTQVRVNAKSVTVRVQGAAEPQSFALTDVVNVYVDSVSL
jgi:hypothetical protein